MKTELQKILEDVAQQYMDKKGGEEVAPGREASNGMVPNWLRVPSATGALPTPMGFSIPIEIPVEGPNGPGTATAYLAFPAEAWGDAPAVIESLMMQGYKVRVFQPRQDRPWQGGGGGYNQGGGGGGYRGGYQGGGNNGYRGGYRGGWR